MLAIAFAATCATASAGLVVSGVDRNVRAKVNLEPLDENPSTAPGAYLGTVQSTSAVLGVFNAAATQTSLTPATMGLSTTGVGHAEASAAPTANFQFSVFAESIMDVTFDVDADGLYAFDAGVAWAGNYQPMNGSVFLLFKDLSNDVTFAYLTRDAIAQGIQSTSLLVGLTINTTYQIIAQATVEGGGNQIALGDAFSDWNFNLAPVAVPEVSSIAMMGLATLAAAAIAWRRRGA